MVTMYDEKWNYNNSLNRYYNGCNYVTDNPEMANDYMDSIMKLKHNCEIYLDRIMKHERVTTDEILNGFNLSRED